MRVNSTSVPTGQQKCSRVICGNINCCSHLKKVLSTKVKLIKVKLTPTHQQQFYYMLSCHTKKCFVSSWHAHDISYKRSLVCSVSLCFDCDISSKVRRVGSTWNIMLVSENDGFFRFVALRYSVLSRHA